MIKTSFVLFYMFFRNTNVFYGYEKEQKIHNILLIKIKVIFLCLLFYLLNPEFHVQQLNMQQI